jgi:hypothetical protein
VICDLENALHQEGQIVNRQSKIKNPKMTPKEIAAHYNAKVFDSPDSAKVAGFVLTESAEPRNVWNKASAASAIVLKLVEKRSSGQVEEIGLVIEPWRVTGCYKPQPTELPAA